LKILLVLESLKKRFLEICIKFDDVDSFWDGQVELYLQDLRFFIAGTVLLSCAP